MKATDFQGAFINLESCNVLRVQPGDVIICKVADVCDVKAFSDLVKPLFPNNKVMILPTDYSVEIVRQSVADSPDAIVGDM